MLDSRFLFIVGLDEEGLLRVSGSQTEVMDMKKQIEAGTAELWKKENRRHFFFFFLFFLNDVLHLQSGKIQFVGKDVHSVGSLLKAFYRELPEPIISKEINEGASAMMCE